MAEVMEWIAALPDRLAGRLRRVFTGEDPPRTAEEATARASVGLAALRDQLDGVEAELREEEAAGALTEEGRERRKSLREEAADLRGRIGALEYAVAKLEPEVIRERALAALEEHRDAMVSARDALMGRARPALRQAVEVWAQVQARYERAAAAALEYGELRRRLEEEFGRNGLPVPPSSIDRQLVSGLRRWEAQATRRELPALLERARQEE